MKIRRIQKFGLVELKSLMKFKNREGHNMEEIFTSLVRVKGDSKHKVISVKSSKKVDRKLFILVHL